MKASDVSGLDGFKYSDDNKRYHTLYYYNLHKYGCRVFKATVDAGLSCPHGSCAFCSPVPVDRRSVEEQFEAEKRRIYAKFPDAKILMYYGIRTNTFCSPEYLRELLNKAVRCGAFAVSVATRPDCVDDEKANILAACPLPITVELGLQTVHDKTALLINRGDTFSGFLRCYERLRERGIRVCVHLINGLPEETPEMMLETARTIAALSPDGVKIHSLHVMKNTALSQLYHSGQYTPLTRDEYIDIVVKQLELLPPETVIERVTGDGDKSLLEAPIWSKDKIAVLGGIDKRMAELASYQGKNFKKVLDNR